MAKLRFFDALPPYFGGKRKLVKAIFKEIPPAVEAPVFADAFMGGGNVSLYAKTLGYRVIANDIAERSYIVGKALIENNKTKISKEDIGRLIIDMNDEPGFIYQNYYPTVFPSKQAKWLDIAMEIVKEMDDGPKKWLSLYLIIKYIFFIRPHSQFSSPNAFNIPFEEGRIENIKQRTYHQHIKNVLMPIPEALMHLAEQINYGIVDNAKQNEIHKMDVLEFLPNIKADIVYFDPPYAGTTAYEDMYHILDEILAGQKIEKTKSRFSYADGQKFLAEVFEAAQHIPIWVLSMGNAGGENECLEELTEMMSKYRRVSAYQVKYRHMQGQASEKHRTKNREYILIGRPK